ncbi:DUF3352 domain-containing protein [Iningainema tapete]|uniref:DUF3352 domain-containing protein n=1 Tax=Iningainema tapete BLCC-T55 TaxID=2748662 RepID=A0A8J6XMZ8_9CYAN|nr:DUF3352 domain-containing protein [Iningainema tapete]MBD2777998.1 DUF3352 domain-containing protein [Iningainema tapete BLCC-T55]
MKQRSFFSLLAASIIVLLLLGLTSCHGSVGKSKISSTSGDRQQPEAAMFVSKSAPVMVSMLVNPERLPKLPSEEVSKFTKTLFNHTDIDYRQDIQPWLGDEITLAVTTLDIDRDEENGQQPGYLMALATVKPTESSEFVELLFSKRALAGANLAVEQYKGVKLIYENRLASAVVGSRFVLFANDPKVLREAINNVQAPDVNLTSSSRFQLAIKQLPQEALATAFLNLPYLAKWQGLQLPIQTYDSQILSLVSKPKGLLAETAFLAKVEMSPSEQLSTKTVGALQYVPKEAGLAISGSNLSNLDESNLAQLWRQIQAAISGSHKDVSINFQSWGINWKEDIFNWVQGEYALGLLPHTGQTNPDWVFVVEKLPDTPNLIDRLDTRAQENGLTPSSITIDEQKVSAWTKITTKDRFDLQAKVLGAHTNIGNYEIFSNSLEAIDEILKAKENFLVSERNFQDSIAPFPQPNQGYLYLDWAKSQQIVERQIPILKLVELVAKPFFDQLKSITFSSYDSNTELLKGSIFFQFNDL